MPYPFPPSPARPGPRAEQVVHSLAVGVATLLLTSCAATGPAASPADPATTSPADPATTSLETSPAGRTELLAQRHTWGGMCAGGACRSTLTVAADGRWTWEDETGSHEGRLGPRVLEEVRAAVATTQLGAATTDAGVRCEADFDGRSVKVAWAGPGGWTEASSCEVRVDDADPLVVVLEDLAAGVQER